MFQKFFRLSAPRCMVYIGSLISHNYHHTHVANFAMPDGNFSDGRSRCRIGSEPAPKTNLNRKHYPSKGVTPQV